MKIKNITKGYINTREESLNESLSSCEFELDELYIKGDFILDDWAIFDLPALKNLKTLDLSNAYLAPYGTLTTLCFPKTTKEHCLETIILPKTLYKISIQNPIFSGFDAPNLKQIIIDSSNPCFATKDGCLYSKDFSILYSVPNSSHSDFTISSSVKHLHLCFFRNEKLRILRVPETPPEIFEGKRTFSSLKLKNINLIVPKQSIKLYKNLEVWKEFNIVSE